MFSKSSPPLSVLCNVHYIGERRLIRKSDGYSRDELDALKASRLRDICSYAYKNCPYYTRLFDDCWFDPESARYPDDLTKLPFLTRQTVQKNFAEMTSGAIKKQNLQYVTTGGSTGTPLGFYLEKHVTYARTLAHEWRQYIMGGVRYFDRRVRLRGRVLKEFSLREGNTLFLSAFHLTSDLVPRYLEELRKFSPDFIEAYPSALAFISEWMSLHGTALDLPGLKAIFLSSETVSAPQKSLMERVWGCKVINKYGTSEQVAMIGQCETGASHEFEEYGFTEYLDEAGKNVHSGTAEIVGTGFVNRATPFIRYKTGDLAKLRGSRCGCGRVHRVIDSILGRGQDYLLGRNSERISGAAINTHSDAFDGVLGFQYVQETRGEATIRVVPGEALDAGRISKIINEASYRTGGTVSFTAEVVSDLEKSPRGKTLFIVRRCD